MDKIKNYNSVLDLVSKLLGVLFKIGLLIGGVLIFAYCLNIGRIPKGITIGDGLFFLWVVFCFGINYVVVLVMLGSAGAVLSPVTAKLLNYISQRESKSKSKVVNAPKLTLPLVVVGILGMGLIALTYTIGNSAFVSFLTVAIVLSFFIPLLSSLSAEFKVLKRQVSSAIYHSSNEIDSKEHVKNRIEHLFRGKILVFSMMIFVPIFLFGFSSVLLQATMKMAGIKAENTEIFVLEPYSLLLGDSLSKDDSKNQLKSLAYTKYTGVNILLRDIGDSVIIEGDVGNYSIPNKYILIGDKAANKQFKQAPAGSG